MQTLTLTPTVRVQTSMLTSTTLVLFWSQTSDIDVNVKVAHRCWRRCRHVDIIRLTPHQVKKYWNIGMVIGSKPGHLWVYWSGNFAIQEMMASKRPNSSAVARQNSRETYGGQIGDHSVSSHNGKKGCRLFGQSAERRFTVRLLGEQLSGERQNSWAAVRSFCCSAVLLNWKLSSLKWRDTVTAIRPLSSNKLQ